MRRSSSFAFVPFLILCALGFSGCASYFLRKNCESKNWYQHGYDLAMRGQRINSDDFVLQCRKAEAEISESQLDTGFKAGMANYCKPDVVFQTGRNGEVLNFDFCEPGQAKILRARHAEGVKLYCEPQNAFQVGSSGKAYTKICSQDQEKAFLPEFQRGRKRFLQAKINETQNRISDLDRRIIEEDRETRNLQMQLAIIPPPQEVINRTVTPTGITEQKETRDPYADKRNQVTNNLRIQESQVRELQGQHQQIKEELYGYQRELQTLD